MLPHLLVHPRVQDPRPGSQVRLERLDLVRSDETLNRVVRTGILQVTENARLGGTNLDAGRLESAGDAAITERAFFGGLGFGIEETAAIGAGLNAKTAADAIFRVHQHDPVRGIKGGADRAGLDAGRMLANVAKLRHE